MNDDVIKELLEAVNEIRDALLGTFEKKGIISRVRDVERVIKFQWGAFVFIATTVGGILIKTLIG